MSTPIFCDFLNQLSRSMNSSSVRALPDAELVSRVATSQDHDAFQALVARHGSMVYGVCRRLVPREQDAEDAFQATFLVLARKAPSIVHGEALVSWLYQVACRVARQSTKVFRRQSMQALPADDQLIDNQASHGVDTDDAQLILEEIERLPDKYRSPIVLCCIEGNTHEAAAKLLGSPPGTISVRLMRAKTKLRERLRRRGITVSAGGLAALLTAQSSFAVEISLQQSTVQVALQFAAAIQASACAASPTALALAKGVLRMMFWNRMKRNVLACTMMLAVVFATGIATMPSRSAPENDRIAHENHANDLQNPGKDKPKQAEPQSSPRSTALGFLHALFGENNYKRAATFAAKKGERQAAVRNRPLREWILQLKPGELDRVQLKEIVFFTNKEFAITKAKYGGGRLDRMWERIAGKMKNALGCLIVVEELEQHGGDRHMMALVIREVEGENRIVYIDDD